MTEGWKCPVCARGVAPGEKSCNHGGGQIGGSHDHIPLTPGWEPPPFHTGTPWVPPWPVTCCPQTSYGSGHTTPITNTDDFYVFNADAVSFSLTSDARAIQ